MSLRPRLVAHARPLRRSARAVQLGLTADSGLVIDGLEPAEVELLGRLDGSLGMAQLYALAGGLGVRRERLELLLARLRERHLLVEDPADRVELHQAHEAAPSPARQRMRASADALAAAYGRGGDGFRQLAARARQHVTVHGGGHLPQVIAALLREGGVGRVDQGVAAVELERSLSGHGRAAEAVYRPAAPDLAVLGARSVLSVRDATVWQRHRVPHLPVIAQGHRVLIGPLVRSTHGPCLTCMDLHRADRDAAWPTLVTQLAATAPEAAPPVDTETSLASTAAGLVAMVVHAHLDGLQVPAGLSLEVALPWPDVVHRVWSAHPRCTCQATSRERG